MNGFSPVCRRKCRLRMSGRRKSLKLTVTQVLKTIPALLQNRQMNCWRSSSFSVVGFESVATFLLFGSSMSFDPLVLSNFRLVLSVRRRPFSAFTAGKLLVAFRGELTVAFNGGRWRSNGCCFCSGNWGATNSGGLGALDEALMLVFKEAVRPIGTCWGVVSAESWRACCWIKLKLCKSFSISDCCWWLGLSAFGESSCCWRSLTIGRLSLRNTEVLPGWSESAVEVTIAAASCSWRRRSETWRNKSSVRAFAVEV